MAVRTEAVKVVHQISNQIQAVLGFIELDQCEKAEPHVKEVVTLLGQLADLLK